MAALVVLAAAVTLATPQFVASAYAAIIPGSSTIVSSAPVMPGETITIYGRGLTPGASYCPTFDGQCMGPNISANGAGEGNGQGHIPQAVSGLWHRVSLKQNVGGDFETQPVDIQVCTESPN